MSCLLRIKECYIIQTDLSQYRAGFCHSALLTVKSSHVKAEDKEVPVELFLFQLVYIKV